ASQRFLITNGSLTFYNSKVNEDVSFTTHNPEYSYDYNIPLSSVSERAVTGSVTFSIYPKDYPAQFGGVSSFSSAGYKGDKNGDLERTIKRLEALNSMNTVVRNMNTHIDSSETKSNTTNPTQQPPRKYSPYE
ncbi:hypothetical protein EBU71_16660, partial [bacterium]|nr:hypothetical protein [Candidatus Elulimicrobium humile]